MHAGPANRNQSKLVKIPTDEKLRDNCIIVDDRNQTISSATEQQTCLQQQHVEAVGLHCISDPLSAAEPGVAGQAQDVGKQQP
jgi:hypothetical protein